jgi:hypothetical protein
MSYGYEAGAVVDRAAHGDSAYVHAGDAATLRRAAAGFYRLVRGDAGLARLFAADPDALRWHQAAQLAQVLGGPDWYPALLGSPAYLPLVVPAAQYHRAGFYLVRAVDLVSPRPAVVTVAWALSAGRCRIIAGLAASRAATVMALQSAEPPPPSAGELDVPAGWA